MAYLFSTIDAINEKLCLLENACAIICYLFPLLMASYDTNASCLDNFGSHIPAME